MTVNINSFTGYRCLRAVGFLSGLAAGAGCIFWLQNKEVTILGSPADYGKNQKQIYLQQNQLCN